MPDQTGDDLLALAIADPARASSAADGRPRRATDPLALSYAHQALGIVLRDREDIDLALRHLRTARRLAGRTGDPDRLADVRATLGATLAVRGRTAAGLRELDEAVLQSSPQGTVRPKVLMRRANVLAYAGHHDAAISDLQEAVPGFRRSGDEVWEARALNLRAYVRILRGEFAEAERDLVAAEALFSPGEQRFEVLDVRHNLALIRFFRGDVPGALAAFAELAVRVRRPRRPAPRAGPRPGRRPARGRALRRGGRRHRVGVGVGPQPTPGPGRPAGACGPRPCWGPGRPELALEDARAARRLFLRQQRDWWRTRADLVALQARIELGRGSRRAAVDLADSLADDATEDAVLAHLLAGRELARTDPAAASAYLSRAAAGRHRGSPLSRTTAWLARALELEVGGRPRVLDAVGRGLDALAEHRASLGSPELRALTALHGSDLATLAVRHALPRGPRALVRWSDRARAASLSQPVPAPQDATIDGLLATIRGLSHRIADEEDPAELQALVRERAQHERAVRLAWAATPGAGGRRPSVSDAALVEHLGDRVLVQLVDVDGTLHAVVVRDGRWRTVRVGPADAGREGPRRGALRAAHRHPRSPGRPGPAGGPARVGPARGRRRACCPRDAPWWSHRRPPCSRRRGPCCRRCAPGRWPSPRRRPPGCARTRPGRAPRGPCSWWDRTCRPGAPRSSPSPGCTRAPRCSPPTTRPWPPPWRRSTGRRWGTSPRTGRSARRRRCSPASTSPTGR